MTELLAPAGNTECLKAAVENGADAVYLGLSKFNARIKADNFSLENLGQWVEYAHLFGVKVYLVINTSIKESELSNALDLAKKAVEECRVDAIIVTDIGFLRILCTTMPNIVVHFSTQMGIHNLLAAQEAERMGAKRIILSRESTARDIEEIKQKTSLEVEVFVHGALCVSFSGGCLLSGFIGGNSGNRGMCMQPCRQFYTARAKDKIVAEGYLLSTADLCAIPIADKLQKSGVDSWKIEGRLRRPEYTAQVVKTYRKLLDGQVVDRQDLIDLKKVYNRGDFTQGYYYLQEKEGLMSTDIQGHKGVLVGRVGDKRDFSEGDAFKVVRNGKEIASAICEGGLLKYSKQVNKDDELFITSDAKQLLNLKPKDKKLKISIKFFARAGQKASLIFCCQDEKVNILSDFEVAAARSAPLTENDVKIQLSKLANTYFECSDICVQIEGEIFIAKSELNELRRKAAEKLKERLLTRYYEKHS